MHSMPQNEPVWPSPMKVRQWPLVLPPLLQTALPPPLQSSQSLRLLIAAQVPAIVLQNWSTGQPALMRQKSTHWPLWHAFFGEQSPSLRQPGPQEAVAALQI
jgi:hypothetical protein